MKIFLLTLLLFSPSLFSHPIDRSMTNFQMHQINHHVDRFDFSGEFPNLQNIDIDGRKKKRVEFDLSGDYPLLNSVRYQGSFGFLKGAFTGKYPSLSFVTILAKNCAIQLDLKGRWSCDCEMIIRGMKEDVIIHLPEDIGLIIHTKTSPSGKVFAKKGLKKQNRWTIWKKTYQNPLAKTASVVLTLNIETTDGKIFLH
ncbi:MAG: hypothetical protein R3E91_04135 [Chlamydiales bacterium]